MQVLFVSFSITEKLNTVIQACYQDSLLILKALACCRRIEPDTCVLLLNKQNILSSLIRFVLHFTYAVLFGLCPYSVCHFIFQIFVFIFAGKQQDSNIINSYCDLSYGFQNLVLIYQFLVLQAGFLLKGVCCF